MAEAGKTMMTSAEIRQKFLDFFKSKAHRIVPSAPIVVKNDPTLLFTNAGMNQFKDFFLGNKKSPDARVADTQKCLRVSGKHNDLEEVGVDTYHHTMFEMLGNWSFGDPDNPAAGYFKAEAIAWSWELLTEVYKLDKERLFVTVFEGDPKENLPSSSIALTEWKKIIPEERIIFGNKKDNFWEMGDTGPCGPCTEIHVDCRSAEERAKIPGRDLVNKDHPQVIEIWNNVFIQYNRKKDGSLEPLPARHVDTGMGFERLVRVLQGKQSNYDTDVFSGTIRETEKITGKTYQGGDDKVSVAFRVLADHIRAIGFTIADGQLPSNTGAGYVIRRILRRAVRYYYSYLDYKQPLLFQLLAVIAEQFREVFPELKTQEDFVKKVIREEEDAFLRTLDKGLRKMDEILATAATDKTINGSAAFELYDTYGFPIDLTRLIAAEQGFKVDEAGFEGEMKQQKERSRAATALETEDWVTIEEGSCSFVGYEHLKSDTRALRYRKVKSKGKESYQLVLKNTPFYAESGGQIGDSGVIEYEGGKLDVFDTKKENDLIIHFLNESPAGLKGDITARVNEERRRSVTIHHSATHLMHSALRQVLGTHVAQKGSLVNDERLRFDFSHFAKMTNEEIIAVERIVNAKIRENCPVVIKLMPKEEATALGAMALFGEKYGDMVRVVIMDPAYSIELCGGTHVGNTGEIGLFKIEHESAVAAGVRRVEAVCGKAAENWVYEQNRVLQGIRESLKNPKDLLKAIENLVSEKHELEKQLEVLEARQLAGIRKDLLLKKESLNGIDFIGALVEVGNPEALKKICLDFRNQLDEHLVALAANVGGKAFIAVSMSEGLSGSKGLDASKIIKERLSPLIKGGGGGQKTLATAGGQDISQLQEVVTMVRSFIA
jgi:alanyl-tRNA synthetase